MTEINADKLNAFVGRMVGDAATTISSALVVLGDKLGLYQAMSKVGAVTSEELARHTNLNERYVREWLANQVASSYVEYDPEKMQYILPPEHALALTDSSGPQYVVGLFQVVTGFMKADEKIAEKFQTGKGLAWGEHHHDVFEGTDRLFRPNYVANLVSSWLPALSGVVSKLEAGALVADVGCGWGSSTIIMAKAFPHTRFVGFDFHPGSIEQARQEAVKSGVADRVTFEIADATSFTGQDYDLITFFDCYHDLPDPLGAARKAYAALAKNGTLMIVEPMAGEKVEDNINPVGKLFYGASTLCCTPNGLLNGGPALGAQASEKQIRELVTAGGFRHFRRVAETPFNRVFEIKL